MKVKFNNSRIAKVMAVAGLSAASLALVAAPASAGPFDVTTYKKPLLLPTFCDLHPKACTLIIEVPKFPPVPDCWVCGDDVFGRDDLVINPVIDQQQLPQLQEIMR